MKLDTESVDKNLRLSQVEKCSYHVTRTFVSWVCKVTSYITLGRYEARSKCIEIIIQKYVTYTLATSIVEVTWILLNKKVIDILLLKK